MENIRSVYDFSLLLFKPVCIRRRLDEYLLNMAVRQTRLQLIASTKIIFSQEQIDIFYRQCIGEVFYRGLSEHLKSGVCRAFVFYGKDAIHKINSVVGNTDPKDNVLGLTIRSYGENIRKNLAHSSANYSEFLRESQICFPLNTFKL